MSVYDNKKFIILQEDDKGYSFKNNKPSGYTKIEYKESKLKIFYYIQNLNNENTYSLSLIIKNESKVDIISIADVKPDENGKIDVSYEFDETLLESLHGSTVCFKDIKGEVKYPLSGFLGKKKVFNWKINQFRLIKNKIFRKENFTFEVKNDISNKKIDKKYNEIVCEDDKNCENEIIEEDNKIDECLHVCDDNNFERNEIDRGKIIMDRYKNLHSFDISKDFKNKNIYHEYEDEIKKCKDEIENNLSDAKYHIDSLRKFMLKDNGKIEKMLRSLIPNSFQNRDIEYDYNYKFFLNILSEYEEMNYLNQENYRFFKVFINDFSQMQNMRKIDNTKYAITYYPMLFMYPYFKDRGYFIIGINCDGKNVSNLVYGIEDDFDNDTSGLPYDGETGFNKYIYDYKNSKRYVIMEYDYKKFKVK